MSADKSSSRKKVKKSLALSSKTAEKVEKALGSLGSHVEGEKQKGSEIAQDRETVLRRERREDRDRESVEREDRERLSIDRSRESPAATESQVPTAGGEGETESQERIVSESKREASD